MVEIIIFKKKSDPPCIHVYYRRNIRSLQGLRLLPKIPFGARRQRSGQKTLLS